MRAREATPKARCKASARASAPSRWAIRSPISVGRTPSSVPCRCGAERRLAVVATEAEVGDEADVGAQRDETVELAVVQLLDDEIGVDREPPDRMAAAQLDQATSAGERLVEVAAQTNPLVALGVGRIERHVDVPDAHALQRVDDALGDQRPVGQERRMRPARLLRVQNERARRVAEEWLAAEDLDLLEVGHQLGEMRRRHTSCACGPSRGRGNTSRSADCRRRSDAGALAADAVRRGHRHRRELRAARRRGWRGSRRRRRRAPGASSRRARPCRATAGAR